MNTNYKLIRSVAVFVCLFLCIASGPADAQLRRAPYLQLATPNSIYVVWRTEGPSEPLVRYGLSPANLEHEVPSESITMSVSADVKGAEGAPLLYQEPIEGRKDRDRRARERAGEHDAIKPDPSTIPNTYQYEALISGLEPGKKYYYSVFNGSQKLAGGDDTYFFRTSPDMASPTSLRIYLAGDTGTGDRFQRGVHKAMLDFVEKTSRPFDMYVHVGDLAYDDGTDEEFSRTFFDVYEPILRNIVCWPTPGNHEVHNAGGELGLAPYYDAYILPTKAEAGGVPSGTEAYYSFQVGKVHFISIDSNRMGEDSSDAMVQWLRKDVENAQGDWMIAFWHDAPYSKGPHDSDFESGMVRMRTRIMPILEDGGVDLVLTGHSHIYERSMLMDGAYETPTIAPGFILDDGDGSPEGDGPYRKSAGLTPHAGTLQIVAGHGSVALGRSGTMPVMRETIVEYGAVILDIDDDTLVGRMIDINDRQRDLFSVVKRGKVKVNRIKSPWQPKDSPSEITQYHFSFRNDTLGQPPPRFQIVSGEALVEEGSNGKALVATGSDESVLGVFEPFESKDVEIQTRLRISSEKASSAGLIVRYLDARNYYYVRLDAANNTFGLQRVVNGKTFTVSEKDAAIPLDEYIELVVVVEGAKFDLGFRGGPRVVANDSSISKAGKMGFQIDPECVVEIRRFEINRR